MIFSSYAFFVGLAISSSLVLFYKLQDFFSSRLSHFKKQTNAYFFINIIAAYTGAKLFFYLSQIIFFKNNVFGPWFLLLGGAVAWGGLIFVYLINYILLKRQIIDSFNFSIACICLCLGQSIGRIGCFFTGCCYGIYSVQLIESLFLLILAFILFKKINGHHDKIPEIYLMSYAIGRFFLEFLRRDQIRGEIFFINSLSISFSQIISLLIISVLLCSYLPNLRGFKK